MKIANNKKLVEAGALISGLSTVLVSLMLVSGGVNAASPDQAEFQKERAACMNGQSGQDRKTCLQELGAAKGESQRGNLTDAPSTYQRNAMSRCSGLPESDRQDCIRRVSGDGATSGSVKGGGIYRETTTVITAPQSSPSSGDSTVAPASGPSGMGR